MKSMLQKMGCGASRKLDNTKLVDDFFGTNYNNKRNSPRQDEDNSINSNDEYDDHFVIDNGDDYPDYSLLRCTDNETQSNPSGRTSRSGDRSGKSGSARSRRSGSYSDRSGRSYRSGGSQRVNMAGSFSGSTSSSRQTEQRRNKGRPEPRSPPPPYMNIYIREDKQPSFSAPISSEDFAANVLLDNILDANAPPPNARATIATAMPMPIPILPTAATPTAAGASNSLDKDVATENTHNQAAKPLATPASVTARTTATATVTPAANNKKEAVGNNPPKIKGAAASSGAKKKKEHKAASSSNAAPVKSNSKTKKAAAVGPTESKTVQIAETKKAASTKKSGGNANTKSSGTNANTNSTTANNNFVPVSVAPPAPPFTSLVRDGNENPRYDDILLSPLTAPTMATMLPQFPKHVNDDEFSTAPSLAGQKRSIVTVSKRVENKNNMTNGINNNNSSNNININSTIDEINFCDSVEKRVTTDKSFDDIYERGKQLGYGAFANVFLATHKPSGAKYAVKEVDRTSMVWNDKDHLQHEIDNMFKVREGPNIVQLYEVYSNNNDDDEDDEEEDESLTATTSSESNHKKKKGRKKKRKKKSLCHLVVELMEGGELFDRIIEKRTFTEREARDSVRCVLEALKYMHDRRVVHRDLKPENLLLKLRDRLTPVKLADFGFAKSIKTKNGCRSLCGTPGYLAPEILERFPSYDVKCDVWSVGAILFLLLGGYLPFDDDNEEKVFDRTRNADYDFQPRCWSNISFGAKELITRCLTVDPRKRFTAEDCLNHDWMSKSKVARDDLLGTDKLQDSRSKGKRKMRAAVKTVSQFSSLPHCSVFVVARVTSCFHFCTVTKLILLCW
jgi:serine/threonine protein kinase